MQNILNKALPRYNWKIGMCFALTSAYREGDITLTEMREAKKQIKEYINHLCPGQGVVSLSLAFALNGITEDLYYTYSNWESRPMSPRFKHLN